MTIVEDRDFAHVNQYSFEIPISATVFPNREHSRALRDVE